MRVRWGILGCGNIARAAVAPAIKWSSNGTLAAVASRSRDLALRLAVDLGAERAHGSYDALLADSEVDAVYIGLPNGLHAEWCARAAEAGKHVLCEKSLTLDADSARGLVTLFASKKLRLVEAFMYRHHPQWRVVRAALPEIGPLRFIRASLAGMLERREDHRWSPTLGGGALFDVTCYGVNVARWMAGTEPTRVTALGDLRDGVDVTSTATLEFPNGVLASVCGSLGSAAEQSLVVVGTKGRIEVTRPFIPDWNATDVAITVNGTRRVVDIAGANHFLHQVEHFAALVQDPTLPLDPAEDGAANVAVCAAIAQSLREARAVDV
jgi:D-xylose 1-dehydrogenase (NADP+, D-xylono-1,5-lactone-forming)